MNKAQTVERKRQRAAAALQHKLHVLPDPVRVARQANLYDWLHQQPRHGRGKGGGR
jgi:hypothetical protein